jgi:hypothetical protein
MILRSSRTLTARKVISSKAPVNAVRLNAALSRTYRGAAFCLIVFFWRVCGPISLSVTVGAG